MSCGKGKSYASVEEAKHSKAVVQLGATIEEDCWCCHRVHVLVPKDASVPVATGRPSVWSVTGAPEFTRRVKLLIRTRAGGGDPYQAACESCGIWLGEKGGEFQHRAARGIGGCRDAVINSAANGVLLCGVAALGIGCHGIVERHPDRMSEKGQGFWIRHGTTPELDPRNVPIRLHANGGSERLHWLTEDGQYRDTAPEELAA
jgi:hypothetical protein